LVNTWKIPYCPPPHTGKNPFDAHVAIARIFLNEILQIFEYLQIAFVLSRSIRKLMLSFAANVRPLQKHVGYHGRVCTAVHTIARKSRGKFSN